jgi:hypothetical protein
MHSETTFSVAALTVGAFIVLILSGIFVSTDMNFKRYPSTTCSGTILSQATYSAGLYAWGEVWAESLGARNTTIVRRFVYPAANKYLSGKTNQDVNSWLATFPSAAAGSFSGRSCYVEYPLEPFSDAITELFETKSVAGWYTGLVLSCLWFLGLIGVGIYLGIKYLS